MDYALRSFDDFLKQDGIYEQVTARAIKHLIARQLGVLMQDQGLTKSNLAKRMQTSRAQLDRLLDPDNESVTLATLTRGPSGRTAITHGAGVSQVPDEGRCETAPGLRFAQSGLLLDRKSSVRPM